MSRGPLCRTSEICHATPDFMKPKRFPKTTDANRVGSRELVRALLSVAEACDNISPMATADDLRRLLAKIKKLAQAKSAQRE